MQRNNRLRTGAIVVMVALFASAIGVNAFYNEANDVRGLDRTIFQAVVATLMIAALAVSLIVTWFKVSAQDEVVRAADRASLYWGWTIGVAVWFLTPWVTSLPEWLVDTMSNPDGDTLFRLSEAQAAYFGGGFVFMLLIVACWAVVTWGWWLAKR